MKILIVTDAWLPQVNGVVTTLVELARELQSMGHEVVVIQPGQFRTRPCPGYAGIDIAWFPGRRLRELMQAAIDSVPACPARTAMQKLVLGESLSASSRAWLQRWLIETSTGDKVKRQLALHTGNLVDRHHAGQRARHPQHPGRCRGLERRWQIQPAEQAGGYRPYGFSLSLSTMLPSSSTGTIWVQPLAL